MFLSVIEKDFLSDDVKIFSAHVIIFNITSIVEDRFFPTDFTIGSSGRNEI